MADLHNYVNFLRGTYKAYDRLKKSGQLDDDVLYFISNPGDTKGSLYLGDVLIGGGETAYLSLLTDVDTSNLANNSILVYNEDTGDWVATDAINIIAEAKTEVYAGSIEGEETFEEAIARITADVQVTRGDIALITKESVNYPFIYTDEKWVDIGLNEPAVVSLRKEVGRLDQRIIELNKTVGNLQESFVTREIFNTKVGKIDLQIKEIKDQLTWQNIN